jgi:outer membrane protein assembly factor BamB
MNNALRLLMSTLLLSCAAAAESASPPLGSPKFEPSPARPVGWRGDWTGQFPGATPPTTWSRRVKGATTALRYQANKPAGEPGKECQPLEYFTIKDWLVAGPYAVQDAVKEIDVDHLGGEASVEPSEGAKAGSGTWKFLRADIDTQSRHDHNEGTCGNTNVDFVYAFGKFSVEGRTIKVDGEFSNKVAYAHTYIHSPAEATVQLRMSFAGAACRVWLNGQPVDSDPKTAKSITLSKGWNRLLIKLSAAEAVGKDYSGRWFSKWMVAAYLMPILPVSYETQNVSWMTKMTGRSMSGPIVVGDRIFVGSNISDLVCISKQNGRVLWLRASTPYDALTPDERAAIPEMKEKIEPLVVQLKTQSDELVDTINAVVALNGVSPEQEVELDKKIKARQELEKKVHNAFAAVDRKKFPPYTGNEVSSSNATPCSDGERVYWVCGGGMKGPGAYAIVCFDLEGKRLWTRHEVLGSMEHGNHQSPALVDGKLIYGANQTLLAMDSKTGAVAWTNAKIGSMTSGISPVVARAGVDAMVITAIKIVRASDGVEISDSKLNTTISEVTPVVDNGMLYNSARFRGWGELYSVAAIKLPANVSGTSKSQAVWDPPGNDLHMPVRGANFVIASPLFLNGILYSVDMTGGMIAVDMKAQKSLYRRWLDGYNRYNRFLYGVSASPTLAGKLIYVTDDAGYTHIIEPGPEFKEAGKNVLENMYLSGVGGNPCKQESFYTAPYFAGSAMYLRGEGYLYCVEEKPQASR